MTARIALAALIINATSAAAAASVCVTNDSATRLFFVAEAKDGPRQTSWLAAGDTLCSAGSLGGVVSVFESDGDLEGCSRLVSPGQSETLLRYVDFDRCFWASNSN